MGDRYYNQMYKLRHPEQKLSQHNLKRKKKVAWTDELKQEVIAAYQAANPTPENSMEIVAELAEEYEQSPNGVRMILSRAGVYVKKTPEKGGSAKSGGGGGGRVSKQDAQDALTAAITDAGQEVDEDIVSKLTGKAAVYFTGVINALNA